MRGSNSALLKIHLKHEAQYQATVCRDLFQTGGMDLMLCRPLTFFVFSLYILVGGSATPLKNMKVNWDDDIPNIDGKMKNVPNHQPVYH